MSRLSNLLRQVESLNTQLGADLKQEVGALSSRRAFGLNFERHIPETVQLPNRPVRKGDKVRFLPDRAKKPNSVDRRVWRVDRIVGTKGSQVASLIRRQDSETEAQSMTRPVDDLVVVAEFWDPIYRSSHLQGSSDPTVRLFWIAHAYSSMIAVQSPHN